MRLYKGNLEIGRPDYMLNMTSMQLTGRDWLIHQKMLHWIYLVEHFGSEKFKVVSDRNKKNRSKQITKHSCGSKSFAEVEESTRDPLTGEKEEAHDVWKLQHTHENEKKELVWSDPQSQQIHDQLEEVVFHQKYPENENPMNTDEILADVLGKRSSYVRGKGYGKKNTKKMHAQQENLEANMSCTMETLEATVNRKMQEECDDMNKKMQEEREEIREEIREEMNKKLQEEHEQMAKTTQEESEKMAADYQKQQEEESERKDIQFNKNIQEQIVLFMSQNATGGEEFQASGSLLEGRSTNLTRKRTSTQQSNSGRMLKQRGETTNDLLLSQKATSNSTMEK